jgi:hypothetical protein
VPTQEQHSELEERGRKAERLDELGRRLSAVIEELSQHAGGKDYRTLRQALHHVERAREHIAAELRSD